MNFILQISNGDENLLKILKSVISLHPQAKLRVKKEQKRTINGFTPEFEREILNELQETEESYKKGEIKALSVKDFRKALQNGEI